MRKTVSAQEYQRTFLMVQALDQAQKVAVLRALSITLARFGAEASLVSPFLTEIALLLGAAFMAGLIVLLSLVQVSIGFPAVLLSFLVVALGFCVGLSVRRILHAGIASLFLRRHGTKSARTRDET